MGIGAGGGSDLSVPPELALVLASARVRLSPERAARLRALCDAQLDWDRVIAEARRHGVDPLLQRHLDAIGAPPVPAAVLDRMRRHAEITGVRNRMLSVELGKVLAQLESRGVAAMPYKGPVFVALVSGDLALRRSADLDVLVRRPDVLRS